MYMYMYMYVCMYIYIYILLGRFFVFRSRRWNNPSLFEEPIFEERSPMGVRPRAGYGPLQDTALLKIRILIPKP